MVRLELDKSNGYAYDARNVKGRVWIQNAMQDTRFLKWFKLAIYLSSFTPIPQLMMQEIQKEKYGCKMQCKTQDF